MPRIDINGISVAYELIRNGKNAIVPALGGYFSKDTPDLREKIGLFVSMPNLAPQILNFAKGYGHD